MKPEELLSLAGGEDEYDTWAAINTVEQVGGEHLTTELIETGRWSILQLDVFRLDGQEFGILYRVGATEYQEGTETNASIVKVRQVMAWTVA